MFELNQCSIIFRPVCQHCGAIIKGEVYLHEDYEKIEDCITKNYSIIPYKCQNCGYAFTSIIYPRNLYEEPYDISDLMECDVHG